MDFSALKVLVVDDMATMRRIVSDALGANDITDVTTAKDGADALPKIVDALKSGSPFDVILCDWNMPNLAGIELLKLLRSKKVFDKTPFIMITSENTQENVIEAVKNGADGYISKPFPADLVADQIELAVEKRKAMG